MAEHARIEDLRRRVEKDPASIAFAQLAEEYRRAGAFQQAVEVCRAGLVIHPGYLSARVTLGRALLELEQLDEAQHELETVLKSAPENLAAIRALADIHHRRGAIGDALAQYKTALTLARNDPDLEQTVQDLSREIDPSAGRRPAVDGLSLDEVRSQLAAHPRLQGAAKAPAPRTVSPQPSGAAAKPAEPPVASPSSPASSVVDTRAAARAATPAVSPAPGSTAAVTTPPHVSTQDERVVAALEQWLVAIDDIRTQRHA